MALGETLLQQGKLTDSNLAQARRLQEGSGETMSTVLLRLGFVSEKDLAGALADIHGMPLMNADAYPDMPVVDEDLLSHRFFKEARVLPIADDGDGIVLVMADPGDEFVRNALRVRLNRDIKPCVGLPSDIDSHYEKLYGAGQSAMGQIIESLTGEQTLGDDDDIEHLKDLASEAPVIRLVNLMISKAVDVRASDIHIEPFESRLKVRYRIDGVLHEAESPPSKLSAAVISRIKLMAKLNIAERRLPQDGRIQLRVQGKAIDLRVSTVPTLYGESVVMRILDKSGVMLDFEILGFSPTNLQRFLGLLKMPHGIILVTGPTGSGKTTTLYTALQDLNTPERKILTVEDPVEYQLEGINQIQVKSQIDLTFANALRAIVRQDPDVIMIGEMRDQETANIAVQAALTGHLVLSTLHTNDAASSVTRLLDMNVEDYLITSTVNGVLAQRLIRVLCDHCKTPYQALPEMVTELNLQRYSDSGNDITLHHAVGCKHCGGTGYRGRAAIHELLIVSDGLRRLVLQNADASDLQEKARQEGMATMYEDGLRKAIAGLTTLEEVERVTREQ